MEELELHLFHGFLGRPEDWDETLKFLNLPPAWKVKRHDLLQDCQTLTTIDFQNWTLFKSGQIGKNNCKKVGLGYSLGGRLLTHLDPSLFDALVLIAAHPGLKGDRDSRLKRDQQWIGLLAEKGPEYWLERWNEQEVFRGDSVRPQRKFSDEEWVLQMRILESFSLGLQSPKDRLLSEFPRKFSWVCGGNDEKFLSLKPRLEKLIGSDRVSVVQGAGHGVIFDRPELLAQWVKKEIHNVA